MKVLQSCNCYMFFHWGIILLMLVLQVIIMVDSSRGVNLIKLVDANSAQSQ